jgi:hypothetical protein
MSKPKPIRILLLDDDEDYYRDLQIDGNRHNIIIDYAKTVERGIIELKKNRNRYGGAIIDINGLISDTDSVTSPAHLGQAIKAFKKICPDLPLVIATNDTQMRKTVSDYGFDKMYEDEIPIFFKANVEAQERMFTELRKKANSLPHIIFRKKHSDVFDIFDKEYLSSKTEGFLIDCIKNIGASDEVNVRKNLTTYRHIISDSFVAMYNAKEYVIPKNLMEPKIKNGDIIARLKQQGIMDHNSLACRALSLINTTVSKEGAHDNRTANRNFDRTIEPPPTKYTLQMVEGAMMDYLLWFKEWMDKNSVPN